MKMVNEIVKGCALGQCECLGVLSKAEVDNEPIGVAAQGHARRGLRAPLTRMRIVHCAQCGCCRRKCLMRHQRQKFGDSRRENGGPVVAL